MAPGEERGLGMSASCCQDMLGVQEPSWELNECQLPGPIRPALPWSQGERGLRESHCIGCFQVWMWLSVMSACLIGTQPSSGARDNMGALPQAGTGLAGLGGRQGMRPCLPERAESPKEMCTSLWVLLGTGKGWALCNWLLKCIAHPRGGGDSRGEGIGAGGRSLWTPS